MVRPRLLHVSLVLALSQVAPAHAGDKIAWPKGCAEAPARIQFSETVRAFCMDFGADYFYRLRFTEETHVFKSAGNEQRYDRPLFSTEGALFIVALAQVESGWANKIARKHQNYWGLSGAAEGTLSSFPSFETGSAFWFNHVERGISGEAVDTKEHPGWHEFLELMTRTGVTTDQINKSLWSGPYCRKKPYPYNMGFEEACLKKNAEAKEQNPTARQTQCPCVDYAGRIRRDSVTAVVSYCLKAYEEADAAAEAATAAGRPAPALPTSSIYPASFIPDQATRLASARAELLKYAKTKCGVKEEAPEAEAVSKVEEGSSTLRGQRSVAPKVTDSSDKQQASREELQSRMPVPGKSEAGSASGP